MRYGCFSVVGVARFRSSFMAAAVDVACDTRGSRAVTLGECERYLHTLEFPSLEMSPVLAEIERSSLLTQMRDSNDAPHGRP